MPPRAQRLYPRMRERPPEFRVNPAWPYFPNLWGICIPNPNCYGANDPLITQQMWRPNGETSIFWDENIKRFMFRFSDAGKLMCNKRPIGPRSVSVFAWCRPRANTEGTLTDSDDNTGGTIFSTRSTDYDNSPDLYFTTKAGGGTRFIYNFSGRGIAVGAVGSTVITFGALYAVCGRFIYSGSGRFIGDWDIFVNGARDNPSTNNLAFAGDAQPSGFTSDLWHIADEPAWGGLPTVDIADVLIIVDAVPGDGHIAELSDPSNVDLRIGGVPLILPPRRRLWPVAPVAEYVTRRQLGLRAGSREAVT